MCRVVGKACCVSQSAQREVGDHLLDVHTLFQRVVLNRLEKPVDGRKRHNFKAPAEERDANFPETGTFRF